MRDTATIDARGLKCPLPVLKAEKSLDALGVGQTLIVLATDPIARIDIPLFCQQNGHGVHLDETPEAVLRFTIVKAGAEL